MYFYYFMLQRYKRNCQQAKCIGTFLVGALPVWALLLVVRHYSETAFQGLLFVLGWVTWTFAEYILHRFWMHRKGHSKSRLAQSHQQHHTHPTEIMISTWHRLLMLAGVVVIIGFTYIIGDYFAGLAGLYTGIVGYFWVHKLLHQPIAKKLCGRMLRYHIYHHCKYPNTCFGISVTWWDDLFGTVPADPKIADRILAFYFDEHHHDEQVEERA